MNSDFTKKNIEYQNEIGQVAKFLFYAFYYNEEERLNYLPDCVEHRSEGEYEKFGVNQAMPKAEKIYSHFGEKTEAVKALKFLQAVNPLKAKEIVDAL